MNGELHRRWNSQTTKRWPRRQFRCGPWGPQQSIILARASIVAESDRNFHVRHLVMQTNLLQMAPAEPPIGTTRWGSIFHWRPEPEQPNDRTTAGLSRYVAWSQPIIAWPTARACPQALIRTVLSLVTATPTPL
jgi:hypothetical protein